MLLGRLVKFYLFPVLISVLIWSCKSQEQVRRYDNPTAQILQGVAIPAGKKLFFTSGIVAPVLDSTSSDPYKRYGDTYTQSVNTMKRIEEILNKAGLGLKDVVFLRIYIAPDPNKNKEFDFAAWFRAYQVFFNNAQNPVKVARTTLGTAALARPELLVEIEAVAVYP
jgi:enamine deaminase RidA (YjgF/YER057c/UK114 family)